MIFRIISYARKLYIVSFSICCFVAQGPYRYYSQQLFNFFRFGRIGELQFKKIMQVQDFVQTCCDDKMNATYKGSRSIHSRDGIGR